MERKEVQVLIRHESGKTMIEIKFSGTYPSEVHNSIEAFMELKKPAIPSDDPLATVTYKAIESSSEDRDHTVTMFGVGNIAHPIACTCMWFRFHPHEKWCAHMKKARIEVLS